MTDASLEPIKKLRRLFTMKFSTGDDIVSLTPLNPFDRFDDGRPKVPDALLEEMKLVSLEEAWEVLSRKHGYDYQFEGNWVNLHPDHVMVGRALTATFVPLRPDLNDIVKAQGEREGRPHHQSVWVTDSVVEGDVIVVDLFGKVRDGTFVGDNMATGVAGQGGAGLVIDGGIRDAVGVSNVPNINVFCRGFDPTANKDVTLLSLNAPIRIGRVAVLPGDVVLGTIEGVIFIPPHLVEEVITTSKETRLKDEFRIQLMLERKYTAAQIYPVWGDHVEAEFQEWLKKRQG